MKHNQKHVKPLKIAFLMDPMEKILIDVDTSISIMIEAQNRGHKIFYLEPKEIVYQNNSLFANLRRVTTSRIKGFKITNQKTTDLKSLDVIFNRKEPPFDDSYLYLTQLLELIERDVFIVNSPRGVRRANEKLYILEFEKWIPPTCVSSDAQKLESFLNEVKSDLVAKPLNGKAGEGIKLIKSKSSNARKLLNQMTQNGKKWIMVQKFLKSVIKKGDKRILMLNGHVIGQFLKIPKKGEFRANLSLGANYLKTGLTIKERRLIHALRPKLLRDGLYFVGIDVLDGKLLEINVTSPAGLPEISELEGTRPEARVVDFLETMVLKER